jgi:hypothetical protein
MMNGLWLIDAKQTCADDIRDIKQNTIFSIKEMFMKLTLAISIQHNSTNDIVEIHSNSRFFEEVSV